MRTFVFVEGRGVVPRAVAAKLAGRAPGELEWQTNHAERRRRVRKWLRRARERKAALAQGGSP
jgi:hypothetical protein